MADNRVESLPCEVHGSTNLPAVDFEKSDECRHEVSRLHRIIAVRPPGAAAQLELRGAVVVASLLESQVPVFDHRLLDSTNKSYRCTNEPQPVVTIERNSTKPKFVHVQIGTPLEDEGVRRGLQVDVAGQPPVVLGEDLDDLQQDEPGLHGGLAAVVDGLAPGLAVDLEARDDRNTSVVVSQGLLRLDSGAPGKVDHLTNIS